MQAGKDRSRHEYAETTHHMCYTATRKTRNQKEYFPDTLESIACYMDNKACRIAILDDSRSGELGDIQSRFTNIDFFEAAKFE